MKDVENDQITLRPKMTGREFTAKWTGVLKDVVWDAQGDPRMEAYIEKFKLNEH